jgi:uncharacterized RDD family membrane protein YckC
MKKENKVFYSGFWRRSMAYCVDLFLCQLILSPVIPLLLILSNDPKTKLLFIIVLFCSSFLVFTLYFALQQSSKHRATFGMRIMKLKICTSSMQKIGFCRSFLRIISFSIISVLYFLPFISLLTIIFSQKKQGLHDFALRTIIVKTD